MLLPSSTTLTSFVCFDIFEELCLIDYSSLALALFTFRRILMQPRLVITLIILLSPIIVSSLDLPWLLGKPRRKQQFLVWVLRPSWWLWRLWQLSHLASVATWGFWCDEFHPNSSFLWQHRCDQHCTWSCQAWNYQAHWRGYFLHACDRKCTMMLWPFDMCLRTFSWKTSSQRIKQRHSTIIFFPNKVL